MHTHVRICVHIHIHIHMSICLSFRCLCVSLSLRPTFLRSQSVPTEPIHTPYRPQPKAGTQKKVAPRSRGRAPAPCQQSTPPITGMSAKSASCSRPRKDGPLKQYETMFLFPLPVFWVEPWSCSNAWFLL